MSGPRRLSAILERWQPTDGGADADAGSAVSAAWPDAVGPDVARRTRAGKLRDGVLTVYTAGSTWSHQLTFLAPSIIAQLQRRCPGTFVQRLRFVVASGRTKALLDGLAQRAVARKRDRTADQSAPVDDEPEHVEDIVARLRRRQQSLDKRRAREGWTRCATCGSWREPSRAGAACGVCAEEARRTADNHIERILINAPWLRRADIASDAGDASQAGYDRVRNKLLARWEEQMFAARRRLRRHDLHAADRVVAWSYLMLRGGMQQHAIGRAVVADVLGEEWADALAGAVGARHREATATAVQKQKNTTARVFTRRDNT